jgi:hypothetical protein
MASSSQGDTLMSLRAFIIYFAGSPASTSTFVLSVPMYVTLPLLPLESEHTFKPI